MLAKLVICTCVFVLGAEGKETPKPAPKPSKEKKVPAKLQLIAIEKSILAATNEERERFGLPPLEADGELMKSARAHCTWMTENQSMQHTQLPVAENIAMGQQDTEQVLNSWMRSPGHRANILNGAFRRIGVAAYQTPHGVIFWCQQFRH